MKKSLAECFFTDISCNYRISCWQSRAALSFDFRNYKVYIDVTTDSDTD